MARSIWKGPYINAKLWNKKKEVINIWSRSSIILPEFIGKTVRINSGKEWTKLIIDEKKIGHKYGEYSMTRKIPQHIKKK